MVPSTNAPEFKNWTLANNYANNMIYKNQRGYLATITTPQESNFIMEKLSFVSALLWIAGTDIKNSCTSLLFIIISGLFVVINQ